MVNKVDGNTLRIVRIKVCYHTQTATQFFKIGSFVENLLKYE